MPLVRPGPNTLYMLLFGRGCARVVVHGCVCAMVVAVYFGCEYHCGWSRWQLCPKHRPLVCGPSRYSTTTTDDGYGRYSTTTTDDGHGRSTTTTWHAGNAGNAWIWRYSGDCLCIVSICKKILCILFEIIDGEQSECPIL